MIAKFQKMYTVISLSLFTRPHHIVTGLERCQSTSVSMRPIGASQCQAGVTIIRKVRDCDVICI